MNGAVSFSSTRDVAPPASPCWSPGWRFLGSSCFSRLWVRFCTTPPLPESARTGRGGLLAEINPLGTDAQGRDVLAALILATPQTLKIGLFAGLIGLAAGVLLGLVAGFFRGVADALIRTVADVAMTIPGIAVLVLVATNVRTMSVALMAVIVAGLAWMYPTRTIPRRRFRCANAPISILPASTASADCASCCRRSCRTSCPTLRQAL